MFHSNVKLPEGEIFTIAAIITPYNLIIVLGYNRIAAIIGY